MVLSLFSGVLKGVFDRPKNDDFLQKQREFNEKISLGLKLQTKAGHMVQSKGEQRIADYLWDNGIPYIYDTLIEVAGKWARPDFILPQQGNIMIEYAGIDTESYKERLEKKLELLASAGLIVMIIQEKDLNRLPELIM